MGWVKKVHKLLTLHLMLPFIYLFIYLEKAKAEIEMRWLKEKKLKSLHAFNDCLSFGWCVTDLCDQETDEGPI